MFKFNWESCIFIYLATLPRRPLCLHSQLRVWHGVGFNPVLVFFCCITNYYKLSSLKHQPFISSQFPWVRNPGIESFSRILCLEAHKAKIKVSVGLRSFLETLGKSPLQALSGCWPNLVPPHIFHLAPSIFKPARVRQVVLLFWISRIFPSSSASATSRRRFSAFKGSCDSIRPIISLFKGQLGHIT